MYVASTLRSTSWLLGLALLSALGPACDDSEEKACTRTTRICEWNEITQQFDRNCKYEPACGADAAVDGSSSGGDAPVDGSMTLSCTDRRDGYTAVISAAKSCQAAADCHVLYGHCGIGLGGCYALVNKSLTQATLDDLATGYQEASCGGPVCDCAPAPPVDCIQSQCANPCPEEVLPNCPRTCGAADQPGTACTAGDVCGNEIGNACTCANGSWACTVHPPLGSGCNLVCVRRSRP
ncbi:MAG: hypothetical protein KA712_23650 [Myxococcales bacterium]|nr:hypothetical protein [Myxococcales bacterium]